MPDNLPASTRQAPARDTVDLEALLGDSDTQLIHEGLYHLREIKVEALSIVRAEGISPHGRAFEPWDFGIPQIDRLLARLGAEPVEDLAVDIPTAARS